MSLGGGRESLVEPVAESQPDSDTSLAFGIVRTVARSEDEPVNDVEPRLYDAVEVDSLERLIEAAGPDTSVRFSFAGYDVVVSGDRSVSLFD